MPDRIKKAFRGSNKYFTVAGIFTFLIILIGFLSPQVIEKRKENWGSEMSERINSIESSVVSIIKEKQQQVLDKNFELKEKIRPILERKEFRLSRYIALFNSEDFKTYSLELVDESEQLIAWSIQVAIPEENFFPLSFDPGEVFFVRQDLITYLSVIDTLSVSGKFYYTALSLPVQKHYHIQNDHYSELDLELELSRRFLTAFDIQYTQAASLSKDGRKHSVEIKSNKDSRIAVVTFNRPSLDSKIYEISDLFINIQSALAILVMLFFLFGVYDRINKKNSKILNLLFAGFFVTALRYLLFIIQFPAKFIEGPLTNPSFFASSFGYGIVKSPIEFFITVLFFLMLCVLVLESAWRFIKRESRSRGGIIKYSLLLVTSVIVFMIFLRGFGASVRSVIFDSSLRYFKEPGLMPNFPAGLMQFNVLLLGLASVLISISIVLMLMFFFPRNKKVTLRSFFIVLFFIFQLTGIIYDLMQREPQGTPLIRFLYITFIFALVYKIYFEERKSLYNYVYSALAASIISISLLNYYNTQLEKESLKTTAFELTRTSDVWLEYIVNETLINASENEEVKNALVEEQSNYARAAFTAWSSSSLQREGLNSSIVLLDREKRALGGFGINLEEEYRLNPLIINYEGEDIQVFNNYSPEGVKGKLISGIIPVRDENLLLGYAVVTILYSPDRLRRGNYPRFLRAKFNSLNSAVDFEELNVFEFSNGKLTNVYGNITPGNRHISQILRADFRKNNEAWITLKINEENYITYILKSDERQSEKLFAVALKEKNLSWSLFNFFKVFFIHSIFIIIFLILVYTFRMRKVAPLKYTFRAQLLVSFLLISLLPLIILAFYNRTLTEKKNQEAIVYQLKKKAENIRDYTENRLSTDSLFSLNSVLKDASRDLFTDFSLYSGKRLAFSSKEELYLAGVLPEMINPEVYTGISRQGYKEEPVVEKAELLDYNSYYVKVFLDDRDYILCVNDLFNNIPPSITGEEMDVFLFGSYSFAIILIVLLSTLLANRISYPIRTLTKATASVAGGDLSFEVKAAQKGEIGNLVKSFNSMIKELKKSQTELAELERETAWKEMARQVAHEIKNPLTPMKLNMQQLVIAYRDKSPKFEAIFSKVSRTIIDQIDTLNNIASEFSSFARMPNLKMEKVILGSIIEDTSNLFIEEKTAIIIRKTDEPITVEADKDQLRRTVINIIRNAIQAGADRIDIDIFTQPGNAFVEFKDNGRGIPQEYVSRVFEPNFTTKEKGMGLGLKMARKFMESIHGSITITGSSPEGTVILLQFPVVY